ncbi:unnamed protein product, partial [Amoebophrya sp. A120]
FSSCATAGGRALPIYSSRAAEAEARDRRLLDDFRRRNEAKASLAVKDKTSNPFGFASTSTSSQEGNKTKNRGSDQDWWDTTDEKDHEK